MNEKEKRTALSLTIWNACEKVTQEEITDPVIENIYYAGMLDVAIKNMRNCNIPIDNDLVRERHEKTEARNQFIMDNMKRFLGQIKEFNYVNLKGPVLNYYVYDQINSFRLMNDCDLLLSEKDAMSLYQFVEKEIRNANVKSSEDLLKYHSNYWQHFPVIRYEDFRYEIHYCLSQGADPYPLDASYMFENIRRINYLVLPSFDMFFISLCQHAFRHEYFELTYKWRNICDIINTMILCPINWENVRKLVDQSCARYVMYYILRRAQTVCSYIEQPSLIDPSIVEMFRSDHDNELENIVFKTYYPGSNGYYPVGVWSQGYLERLFKGKILSLDQYDPVSADFNYQFSKKVQYDNNIFQCKAIDLNFVNL